MKTGCLIVIFSLCPMLAHAEIYKAVDADGHVTYSSEPIKGGRKIVLEPLPTMAPPRPQSSHEAFPRVDSATQKDRDGMRRKILLDELDKEEKLLAESRQNLAEGEKNPEVYHGKDGKTYRNVAKYEEKIKSLKDQVDLHGRNIESIRIELSRLK